jgi:hypothetical protein
MYCFEEGVFLKLENTIAIIRHTFAARTPAGHPRYDPSRDLRKKE